MSLVAEHDNNVSIYFNELTPSGQALGRLPDGRPIFVLGVIPGERARIQIKSSHLKWALGELIEIEETSPYRSLPREVHALACSPWQDIVYSQQLRLKNELLISIMKRPNIFVEVSGIAASSNVTGYRNKIEFFLTPSAGLALRRRGSHELIAAPTGCVLASSALNIAAHNLGERLRELDPTSRPVGLTLRQSSVDDSIAAIAWYSVLPTAKLRSSLGSMRPTGVSHLEVGVQDRRGSRLISRHRAQIAEKIGALNLSYPLDGFCQVNLPTFLLALEKIHQAVPEDSRVLDCYGGAGTIGLSIASKAAFVAGYELSPSLVNAATMNAQRNNVLNYRSLTGSASRITAEKLQGYDVVIVDPPRAGLDTGFIDALKVALPERLIYLSCDPATQIRDIERLSEYYDASPVDGFDFFPGTPHLESLVVLNRK